MTVKASGDQKGSRMIGNVLWFRIPAKATSEAAAGPAAPEQQPVAAGG
jgi:hypothetical protein